MKVPNRVVKGPGSGSEEELYEFAAGLERVVATAAIPAMAQCLRRFECGSAARDFGSRGRSG